MARATGPVLVFGLGGQVGSELERALLPFGPVVAFTRRDVDIANAAALAQAIERCGPRLIVNAAAYTAVDRAESEPERAFEVNGAAPARMAEEALERGIPLVHYSTDYVFDGAKDAPYVETDAPHPLSVYGRSKLAGEEAIRRSGVRGVILRTSWVFGETGQNFVRTVLRLAGERDRLRVVNDQVGAPTPAALLADVTAHLVRAFDAEGWPEAEIYHLTSTDHVSWHAYAQAIVATARELGIRLSLAPEAIEPIATEEYPTPALRPRNSRLDCTRIEQRLEIKLPGWRRYLQRMIERLCA
jgi:dTDP-4-dehydrorhamnose reductase